ncbi:MAG: DUF4258 domain-containing protein [Planctomycetes bacterium]|nr:DUF4258 domain-containing protein [Planctomycetota bacterium]
MTETPLQQIRDAVREGRHRLSHHAVRELAADGLLAIDAESAVLTGTIVRIEKENTPQQPGPRYTVVGKPTDLTSELAVVFRFETAEQLLIITCYEVDT